MDIRAISLIGILLLLPIALMGAPASDAQIPPPVPQPAAVLISIGPLSPIPVVEASPNCTVSTAPYWAEAVCIGITERQGPCFSPWVQAQAMAGKAKGWVQCSGATAASVTAVAPGMSIAAAGPSGVFPFRCGASFSTNGSIQLPGPTGLEIETGPIAQVFCYGPDP